MSVIITVCFLRNSQMTVHSERSSCSIIDVTMFSILLSQIITPLILISLTYQHQFWNSPVKYTKYVLNLEDVVYLKAYR